MKKSSYLSERVYDAIPSEINMESLEYAIYSEDGADVNWIGVKLFGIKENQWMIQALPNTLYDGTVGINLVFHLYEWIYHDRKYHKICEVLDNRLLRYIDTISEGEQNIEDFNTGIFSGEGSILYTLGILYEIIYVFLTIFLYLLKCPQSLILSALRAFCLCGKPHISRLIFLYFPCQSWLKSW